MRRFLFWLGISLGIIAIFSVAIYLFISELLDTEPVISRNSYVQMQLGGTIPEYNVPDALEEYLGSNGLNMQKVRNTFRMAAVDDRIEGIVLKLGFLQSGFAKLADLRQMIQTFQTSGKKVIAHLDFAFTRDYYLASFCDSIFLQPGGTIFLNGFSFEVTFYKGFFSKIGVQADFEHIGKYKNAPDIYTRQTMSEPQREVLDEILNFRFNEVVEGIANARDLEAETVNNILENIGGLTGPEALEFGLIDGIRYSDTLDSLFIENDNELQKISLGEYSRIKPQSVGLEKGPRIAVIYCVGTITGGEDGSDPFFGNTMGAQRVIRNIKSAVKSNSVKAIILRINSPGGSSLASDEIWHAIDQAREKKPIIASISDLGASGGYYIALAADKILAQPGSLVGSIGIFGGKFSLDSMYQSLGLNTVALQRGRNARMFSLNSTFSPSERRILRKSLQNFYELFLERVASSRQISIEETRTLAQGRVWTADQSLNVNLIDQLGSMDDAISLAKKLAEIDSTADVRLIYYPKKKSFLGQLVRTVSHLKSPFINPVARLESYLSEIQGKPLALMPFILSIK